MLTIFSWALKATWQSYYSSLDHKLVHRLQLKFWIFSHLLKFSCLNFLHTPGLQLALPSCLLKTLILTIKLKCSLHLLYFISLLGTLWLSLKGKSDLLFQSIPMAFCSTDMVLILCLMCCIYCIHGHIFFYITDFLCVILMNISHSAKPFTQTILN